MTRVTGGTGGVGPRHAAGRWMAGLAAVLIAVLAFLPAPAFAQDPRGLAGGPVLGDGFRNLEKRVTICPSCTEAQSAYHAAVDNYRGERARYDDLAGEVRAAAERFVEQRDLIDTLQKTASRLDALADEMRAEDAYTRDDYVPQDEASRNAAEAYSQYYDAREDLPAVRAELDAALDRLEVQRGRAVAAMQTAIGLELAMYRCEFACETDELDLDIRVGQPEPPASPNLIDPSQLPEIENFVGVVAACAECLPLSEKVNQLRSHLRSFASAAHSFYESMVNNQQRLDRLAREATALEAEERQLYEQLARDFEGSEPPDGAERIDWILDKLDQREATDALRTIAARRAEVSREMAGTARTVQEQFQAVLENIANYHAHTVLLANAQRALEECEKNCPPPPPDPATDPFIDPSYPMQENFGPEVAKCWECQPLVEALTKTRLERRSVAGDIQTTVWLLKGRRGEIERKSARYDELEAETRELGELLRIGEEGGANVDYALRRLFEIENEQTQLTQDIVAAEFEIPELQSQLDTLMARHTALSRLIEEQRAAVEICEFNKCKGEDGRPLVSLTPPLVDSAYPVPEPYTYAATDCLSCQPIADQINALLLERYTLAGRIQSTVGQIASDRAALADLEAQLPELADRISEAGWPYQNAETPEERARTAVPLDAAIDAERRVEAEIETLRQVIAEKEAEVETMLARHAAIRGELRDLQRRLAVCERNCADPEEEDIFLAGQDPFVATDCPPCVQLASQVNDAVGSLINARRALAEAQKAFEDLAKEADARRARLSEVDAEIYDLAPRWSAAYAADPRPPEYEEIDARFDALDLEQRRLQEEQAGEAEARRAALADIDRAQQRVDDLTTLIAKLKLDLLDCEKQCQPPDEDGQVALPETPFVATDCPPCQVLASRVNDVVGSLISLRRQLAEARSGLDALRTRTEELETAKTAAAEAYDRLQDEFFKPENRDRQDDLSDALYEADDAQLDAEDAVQENERAIEDAMAGIRSLEAQIAQYEAAETDLRGQLAECEKECQPPEEGTETALPETPFVTTDCPDCARLASMVNDVVGSRIGTERRLAEARAARAVLDTAAADRDARMDELRDLLRENERARDGIADIDEYTPFFDEAERLGSELARLQFEKDDAPGEIEKAEKAVADLEDDFARLTQQEADLKAQLAECEERCNQPEETALAPDPDHSPFVRTDCPACARLASIVNDAVGSHIGAERAAQTQRGKIEEIRADIEEMQARVAAETDAVDKSFLEDDLNLLELDLEFAEDDLAKAEARVADLARQVAALKAQLAECERECNEGDDSTDETALAPEPEPEPDPRFARTDCEPCLQIVAALNDVIGSRIGTEERLAQAQAAHDRLAAELAEVDAGVQAAQDAFAAAAVEKARLEAADEDASAQEAIFDENLDRAAELSFDSDALFPGVQAALERVREVEAELAALDAEEARLRAALAECEDQCGGASAAMLPDMLLEKLQEAECRAGGACTFELTATNQSDADFSGPLFLSETGRVEAGGNGALFGGWHCSPAAGGASICLHEGGIGAGEAVGLSIPIRLPGYVAAGSENCIRLEFATDPRKLLQLIQAGLAARGLNPGAADGLMGPRTRAAIRAFGEATGQEVDPNDLPSVYRAMFRRNPSEAPENAAEACIEMEVENPPRTAPRPNRTTTNRTTTSTTQPAPQPQPRTGIGIPGLQITIPFGESSGESREGGHASPGGFGLRLNFGE
jgi:chromosome segregation ATPase